MWKDKRYKTQSNLNRKWTDSGHIYKELANASNTRPFPLYIYCTASIALYSVCHGVALHSFNSATLPSFDEYIDMTESLLSLVVVSNDVDNEILFFFHVWYRTLCDNHDVLVSWYTAWARWPVDGGQLDRDYKFHRRPNYTTQPNIVISDLFYERWRKGRRGLLSCTRSHIFYVLIRQEFSSAAIFLYLRYQNIGLQLDRTRP